ncbi:MAG: enoyl-CoA hydratase/isomerase family protein [Deltaproteobacteria bacterium]|nr:MAG: enoyl-CoA hydratase/isomerase family protein [Deltaproteobacteria bacterium]
MSQEAAVLYRVENGVGIVELNRPDNRNSMTPELFAALGEVIQQVKSDASLRCVVITGRGRCFSAGADLRSNIQVKDQERHQLPHERSFGMYTPFLSVLDIEVPVIGALNGHAVGGGLGLALVCDIRIANKSSKYGANFTKLGIHPGMAITHILPRLVGFPKAAELLFTGKLIKGEEAASVGLVNHAVEGEDVFNMAMEMARDIANNAPIAVRLTKRFLYQGQNEAVRNAAYAEAFAQASTLDTQDAQEGINALLEKRQPEFQGK